MTSYSFPISRAALTTGLPTRDKTMLIINREIKKGIEGTTVRLELPLDAVQEAELHKALGGHLSLRYWVPVNLQNAKELIQEQLAQMYRKAKVGEKLIAGEAPLTLAEQQELLVDLARHGHSLYHRMFREIQPEGNFSSSDAIKVQQAVASALSRPQLLCIDCDVDLFPWAFLYDGPGYDETLRSSIDPGRFWGFRHEIQQHPPGTTSHIVVPGTPTIVAAICHAIDGGRHSSPRHPMSSRPVAPRIANISELGQALADFRHDCFYFYGHAGHGKPASQATSWLQLNNVKIYVSALKATYQAPRFYKRPTVVFLNGCRTAALEQWNSETAIGMLSLDSDAHICCVGAVGEIPESFAAEFSKYFWSGFLEGKPIGRALLDARVQMLEGDAKSFLGLLYQIFGRVDTYVDVAGQS